MRSFGAHLSKMPSLVVPFTRERSAGLALGALNSLTDVKDVNFEEYSILRDNRYAALIEFIGQKLQMTQISKRVIFCNGRNKLRIIKQQRVG